MTWTRFSDDFTRRVAVARLSDAAFRVHVEAYIWSNAAGTDGRIPAEPALLARILPGASTVIDELAADLWELDGDEYQLDWSDQELAERVQQRKAFNAERNRVYRERGERHRQGDHSLCTDKCAYASQDASRDASRAATRPVPTRPVPSEGLGTGTRREPDDAGASPVTPEQDDGDPHHSFVPDDSGHYCTTCGTGPTNRRHRAEDAA